MVEDKHPSFLLMKGAAGLGNRLFSVANGIEYALKNQRTVLVDWSDGQFALRGTDAFRLCFQLKNVEHINRVHDLPEKISSSYPPDWGACPDKNVYDLYRLAEPDFSNRSLFRRLFRFLPKRGRLRKLKRYWYIDFEQRKHQAGSLFQAFQAFLSDRDFCVGGDLPDQLKEELVFHVDYCPECNEDILRNYIDLQPEMQQKIEDFRRQHEIGANTIGVHVRMTDAMPENTLNSLLQKIQKIPLQKPDIFLATDNDDAVAFFKEHFSHVITIPKVFLPLPDKVGRHSYASFAKQPEIAEVIYRESVMDMFLLAKCEYLVAQKNSSFSKVSAIFKNTPEKTCYW